MYLLRRKRATAVTVLLLTLALLCSLQTQEDLLSLQTNELSSQTNEHSFQTNTPPFQFTVVHQSRNRTTQDASPDPYSGIAKGNVSWLQTPEDFFLRLEHEKGQTHCHKMTRMGGKSCRHNLDGHKYVCLDPDLQMRPRPCVVYSFGVSTDISFDTKVNEFGCHVYLMDPTLPPGSYHWLTGNMKFFPYGLAHINKTVVMNITNFSEWEGMLNVTVLPFDVVQQVIGHSGTVHYLKMDVEGSEWSTLRHMMDNNLLRDVLQIGIEIHVSEFIKLPTDEAVKFLRHRWLLLEELEDHGFLRARYDPTNSFEAKYTIPGTNRTVQTCGELLLLRRADVATRLPHQLL